MKRYQWVGLAIAGAVIAGGCGLGSDTDHQSGAPINASDAAGASSPSPVKTKAGTIGDGTWTVGKQIKPGTYRSAGGADASFVFCSWSIKNGAELRDMGNTDKKADPQEVELAANMKFETSGCAVWVKQ